VRHCVESLGCASGAFLVPEKAISVIANRKQSESPESAELVMRTQKHLLAWVQLNDRPMIVNRIGTDAGMAPYKILSCPVRDPGDRVTGLMALFRAGDAPNFEIRDVRILEYMSRKAMSIINSEHDPLTGLMNRVTFENRIEAFLRMESSQPCSLIYVDIDRLQAINDAFGFQAGDEVIRQVAEVIRQAATGEHFACRIAGDRFAVFCTGADGSAARDIAGRVRESAAQLGYLQGADPVPVSLSIGIADPTASAATFGHLLASAEIACKRARTQGGNRVEIDEATDRGSPAREHALVAAASLKHALLGNEFTLQAQPLVDLYSDLPRAVGYEVFVRMRDAQGELISADKFIEAAERYDLMPAIDKWVLAATVKALSGRAQLPDLPLGVAINVSAQSLRTSEFADFALAEIARSSLPASTFCFEIREAAAASRLPEAERFIARVTAAGAQVSLDDFGAGLSSLAHLKRLKVSHLKIDGSLIRRVLEDIHAESLVRGLARAAQTLGVLTVAEHVESEALATKLKGMEIDLAQGYYYGHPKPLARALAEAAATAAAVAEPAEPRSSACQS
jgi:diguanylate cyclase (GGDEF)-like protein